MSKPAKTSFRKAVDYLKEQGIIKNDNDLLPILGLQSKGTLSAYLKGQPPEKILIRFQNKFSEYVTRFFAPGAEAVSPPVDRTDKYITLLENQLEYLQEKVNQKLRELYT